MATLDIRGTVVGETAIAIKAPCLVATTANITLSGVQTIDGVSVGNASERVLVKNQSDKTTNGVYIASTGAWVLAADFTSNNNVALGTLVLATSGNVNAGLIFEQTNTDNPIVIGTSTIAFTALPNATAQAATSTTSLTIGTGSKTLTIQTGKAFVAGQYVVIYETAAPATNSMLATVTSYSSTTLVVNVVATTGSGTFTDWSIVLTNSAAGAGIQPPVGSGNVTGPGSAVDTHLATFSGTTGKVIQDGGAAGSLATLSTLTAQYLAQSAVAFGASMINGQVVTSASANALTFTIQTLAGATPSATDPVWFVFRTNASFTSGALSLVSVTAALSVTIPSGSTLGSSNATPFRIWLAAVTNGGTVSLAVINCLSGTSIFPFLASGFSNVTAFGGGANSAQVLYGATSITNPPYSVIGYASYEAGSTLPTAGTYTGVPTRCDTWRPGLPLPGQVVQTARNVIGAVATGSTALALADTIPTSSQGDQYMSQAITPSSSANLVEIETQAFISNGGGSSNITGALFQDAVANALSAIDVTTVSAGSILPLRILHLMLAATLSSTTFKFRAGSSASTNTFNGTGGARSLGGVFNSFMQVREIMA